MADLPISFVVDVQITRQASNITRSGFGVPLILGDNGSFGGELVREYSNIDEVGDDFATTDDEYVAALRIFGQSPRVNSLKIGIEGTRVAQVQTITFSADLIADNVVNGTVDGVALTATTFAVDHVTTMGVIAGKIQATAGVATATVGGVGNRVITVTAQAAGVPVSLTGFLVTLGVSQATAVVATTTANVGVQDFLAAIREEDDDWYGLIWTERSATQVLLAAAYIEAQRKIYFTVSSDAGIGSDVSTTDIAYLLEDRAYNRTSVWYNADPTDFADAAAMGKGFPYSPGTFTWHLKTLTGVVPDNLTTSFRTAALAKNANLYVTGQGVNMSITGTMASGLFIDEIRDVDWLQAQMEEGVFARLISLPRIPFTDGGIAIIENVMRGVLENAENVGVLADDPKYTVTVPRATEVSELDRADRLLPDLEFTGRLSGAIHKVTIRGVVTV